MITVRELVDRVGPTPIGKGDLVLGVTAGTEANADTLVRYAGEHGAAAVLLKPPLASTAAVAARARQTGTALVEVHGNASWAQLVWLLRTVLDAAADEQGTCAGGTIDVHPAGHFVTMTVACGGYTVGMTRPCSRREDRQ